MRRGASERDGLVFTDCELVANTTRRMRRRRGDQVPTTDDDDPTASIVVVREDDGRNDGGKTAATRGLVRRDFPREAVPFVFFLTHGADFRDFIRDGRAATNANDDEMRWK